MADFEDKKTEATKPYVAKKEDVVVKKEVTTADTVKADVVKKTHDAFLSEDDKLKIQAEVAKELDEENRKRVAADYKNTLIKEAKKKALLKNAEEGTTEDGLVPVYIDLPAVSECIRLDGVAYYPGRTYNVTPQVREVMNECMGRGRDHEDSLNGKTAKENAYRRKGQTKAG